MIWIHFAPFSCTVTFTITFNTTITHCIRIYVYKCSKCIKKSLCLLLCGEHRRESGTSGCYLIPEWLCGRGRASQPPREDSGVWPRCVSSLPCTQTRATDRLFNILVKQFLSTVKRYMLTRFLMDKVIVSGMYCTFVACIWSINIYNHLRVKPDQLWKSNFLSSVMNTF